MESLYLFIRACIFIYLWSFSSVYSEKPVPQHLALPNHNTNSLEIISSHKNSSHQTVNKTSVPEKHDHSKHIGAQAKLEQSNKVLSPVPIVNATTNHPHHHNVSETKQVIDNTLSFQRLNSGAVLRGFYVLVGLSIIVVMYLVVRSIRLRRKVSRVHKYGILASREDVEMTPLGAEDEDDDTIVFDLSNHHSTQ